MDDLKLPPPNNGSLLTLRHHIPKYFQNNGDFIYNPFIEGELCASRAGMGIVAGFDHFLCLKNLYSQT